MQVPFRLDLFRAAHGGRVSCERRFQVMSLRILQVDLAIGKISYLLEEWREEDEVEVGFLSTIW